MTWHIIRAVFQFTSYWLIIHHSNFVLNKYKWIIDFNKLKPYKYNLHMYCIKEHLTNLLFGKRDYLTNTHAIIWLQGNILQLPFYTKNECNSSCLKLYNISLIRNTRIALHKICRQHKMFKINNYSTMMEKAVESSNGGCKFENDTKIVQWYN